MTQSWLKTNVRPFLLGSVPSLVLMLVGGVLVVNLFGDLGGPAWRAIGWSLVVLGVLGAIPLLTQAVMPRISYGQGEVLFHLRFRGAVRVPLEFVEAFLLGQGPSWLPGKSLAEAEATTLVVRLAERAEAFERVSIHPLLGSWCDYYVTLRGAWCEPLDVGLVNRLNQRLHETKRQQETGRLQENGKRASEGARR